jgi:hypothetical protein
VIEKIFVAHSHQLVATKTSVIGHRGERLGDDSIDGRIRRIHGRYAIGKRSQACDGNFDLIARLQEDHGPETEANACGSTGREDITNLQSLSLRQRLDKISNVENELIGCGTLSFLAVDESFNLKDLGEMFFRDSNGAHRTKGVWTFAYIELLVISLAFSCSHVVDNGIAPNVIQSVFLLDAEAWLADNDTYFAFVVGGFGEFGMWINVFPMGNDGGCSFGKDDGMGWLVDFIGGIVPDES